MAIGDPNQPAPLPVTPPVRLPSPNSAVNADPTQGYETDKGATGAAPVSTPAPSSPPPSAFGGGRMGAVDLGNIQTPPPAAPAAPVVTPAAWPGPTAPPPASPADSPMAQPVQARYPVTQPNGAQPGPSAPGNPVPFGSTPPSQFDPNPPGAPVTPLPQPVDTGIQYNQLNSTAAGPFQKDIQDQNQQKQLSIENQRAQAQMGFEQAREKNFDERNQIAQEKEQDVQGKAQAQSERNDWNAAADQQSQNTGQKFQIDPMTGKKMPVTENGRPIFNPSTSPVQTDAGSGVPYVEQRDKYGNVTRTNPGNKDLSDTNVWTQDQSGNWNAVPATEALSTPGTPMPAKMQAARVLWTQEQQTLKDQSADLQEQVKTLPPPLSPALRTTLEAKVKNLSTPIPLPPQTVGVFGGKTDPTPDQLKDHDDAEATRVSALADAQTKLEADDNSKQARTTLAQTNNQREKSKNDGPGGFLQRFKAGQTGATDLAGGDEKKNDSLTDSPVPATRSNPSGNPDVPAAPDLTPLQATAAIGQKQRDLQQGQDAYTTQAKQLQSDTATQVAAFDREEAGLKAEQARGMTGDQIDNFNQRLQDFNQRKATAAQALQARSDTLGQQFDGLKQKASDLQDFVTTTQKRLQPQGGQVSNPAAGNSVTSGPYQWNTDGNLINGQTKGKDNVVGVWKNGALEVPDQKDLSAALSMAGEKPVYLTPQDKPEDINPYGLFAGRMGGAKGGLNAGAQSQWAQNNDLERKLKGDQVTQDTAALDKQRTGIEADVSAKMTDIQDRVLNGATSAPDGQKEQDAVLDAVKAAHGVNDAQTSQKMVQAMDDFSNGKINSKQLNDLYAAAGAAKPGTDIYQDVAPQLKQNALADAQKQYQNGQMSPDDLAGVYKQLGIDMPKGDWTSYFHNLALQTASGAAEGVGDVLSAVGRVGDLAGKTGTPQGDMINRATKLLSFSESGQKLIDNAQALGSKGLVTAAGTSSGGDPRYVNDFVTNSLKGAAQFAPSMISGEGSLVVGALQGGESYAQEAKKAGLSDDAVNANFALGAVTMGGMQKVLGPVKWLHEASDPTALLTALGKTGAGTGAQDILESIIKNTARTAAEGGVLSATGQAGLYYGGAKDKDGNPVTSPFSTEGLEGDLQGAAGMTVFAPLGVLSRARGLKAMATDIDARVKEINDHNEASGDPTITAKDYITANLNAYKGQQVGQALTDIQSKFHAIDQNEKLTSTQILAQKNKLLSSIPDDVRPRVIAHLDAIGQAHDNLTDLWQAAEQEMAKAPTPEAKQAISDQAAKGSDDINRGLQESMHLIENLGTTPEGKKLINRNNAWNSRPGGAQPMDIRNTYSNSDNAADIGDEIAKNRLPFDAAQYSMAKKANNDRNINFDPATTAQEMTGEAQAQNPAADPIKPEDVTKATELLGKPGQTPRSVAIKAEQAHWEKMLGKARDRGDVQGMNAIHDHLIHLEQQQPRAHKDDLRDGIAATKEIDQAPPHTAPAARALVKIGTGKPLRALTSSELQGAGISSDGKGGYKANVTADDLGNPSDPKNKKPVHMGPVQFDESGQPHVTDEAKANLATTMPNTAKLIPDEMSSRLKSHIKLLQAEQDAKEATAQAAKPKPEAEKPSEKKEDKAEKPEWVGHGEDGTEVRISSKEAKNETEAREKLAGKLPEGERLKDVEPPKAEPKANKEPLKKTLSSGDDLRARMEPKIKAQTYPAKKALYQRAVDIVAPELDKYSDLFPGGVDFEQHSGGGGLAYETESKQLRIDMGRLIGTIRAEENNGGDAKRLIRTFMKHEVIHRAAMDVVSKREAADLWNKLDVRLRAPVRQAYFASSLAKGDPLPPDNPEDHWKMGHEFLRMMAEDKLFGMVTEGTFANRNLVETIRNLLTRIGERLNELLGNGSITHPETKALVHEAVAKIESRLKDLGIMADKMDAEPPASNRVEPTTQEGARPPPKPFQFEPEKVEAQKAAIEEKQAEKPKLPFQDAGAYGNSDTAYTDKNEPIKYQWAVSSAKKLIVSNHDNGAVNPNFPQDLQPRDRTSAASQMQVNDIKNNMNFVRLSGGDNVSGGSPMTGNDGVVESGNGRVMGMRRGYSEGTDSSKAYKADLIKNAAKYGLDPDKIAAIDDPILHRERITDVDRRKFAEVANGANIMPMREVETARKDAHNLSPAVLDLFNPDENGDMFAASNLPFLTAFNKHVVPEGERAAVVDKDGMISQTGARRIRNALFAYAYGSTPKGMSALGRMTESVDPEGKNLTNALLAAAPGFAKSAGKIKSGALHPLSISDDVLAAATRLMELKAKGEKVSDFMAQREMFGDQMTDFQKGLLQFFDKNGRSAKKMGQALNRYNALLDQGGHPEQADMLGGAAPTKEGFWNLAKKPAQAPDQVKLLSSPEHVSEPPPLANNPLKVYNRLSRMQSEGVKLNAGQAQLLETAEKQLGQKMIFDEAQNFKATKAKIDGARLASNIGRASVGRHELADQSDMFSAKPAQGSLFSPDHPAHLAAHEIRNIAETHKEQYLKDASEVGKGIGLVLPESSRKYAVKDKESLDKKLVLKPGKIPSDLLRTNLISTLPKNAIHGQVLDLIKGMHDRGYQLYNPGGKLDVDTKHTSEMGYKDIALKFVKLGDPIVRELQVIQPAMKAAKDGQGHQLYKIYQKLETALKDAVHPQDREDIKYAMEMNKQESDAIYARAYAADNQSSTRNIPYTSSNFSAGDMAAISAADSAPALASNFRALASRFASPDTGTSTDLGLAATGRSLIQGDNTGEVSHGQPESRLGASKHAAEDGQLDMFSTLTSDQVDEVHNQERGLIPGREASKASDAGISDIHATHSRRMDRIDAQLQSGALDAQQHGKLAKGYGMQRAADLRKAMNTPTWREKNAVDLKAASNFKGKEVSVDGKKAIVQGQVFGKTKVQFEDGSTKNVEADEVKPRESLSVPESPNPQTETPEFKKWFGKSKMVNKEGVPIVLYHGTHADVDTFDPSHTDENPTSNGLLWFGSKETAESYGHGKNLMPVYLKMEKPYRVDYIKQIYGGEPGDSGYTVKEDNRLAYDEENLAKVIGATNSDGEYNSGWIEKLKSEDYDGIIVKNIDDRSAHDREDGYKPSRIYAVFDSRQIKSVTKNSGKFDPKNPSILKSPEHPEEQTNENDQRTDSRVGQTIENRATEGDPRAVADVIRERASPSEAQSRSISVRVAERSALVSRENILKDFETGKYQDGGGATAAESANYDMMHHLDVPDGWKVEDIIPSQYGSAYWKVRDPHDNSLKVTVRDHEPSPLREKEFDVSDIHVFVNDANDPEQFNKGMSALEQRLHQVSENPKYKLSAEDYENQEAAKRPAPPTQQELDQKRLPQLLKRQEEAKDALTKGIRIGNGKPITTDNQRQNAEEGITKRDAEIKEIQNRLANPTYLDSPRHVGDLSKGQPSLQLGMYRNPGEFDLAAQLERDTRDDRTKSKLVDDNMGLATHIATRYKVPGVDTDDVIQEARIGLMKAAQGFDASKGSNFSSYAGRIIHNRLNDAYRKGMNIANREEDTLDDQMGDSGKTREEVTPDPKVDRTLPIERAETAKITEKEVSKLPERPQAIVRGLMAGMNGEEIAQKLGMSRQGVNQSLKGALMVLKKRLEARGLMGQEDGILHTPAHPDETPGEEAWNDFSEKLGDGMIKTIRAIKSLLTPKEEPPDLHPKTVERIRRSLRVPEHPSDLKIKLPPRPDQPQEPENVPESVPSQMPEQTKDGKLAIRLPKRSLNAPESPDDDDDLSNLFADLGKDMPDDDDDLSNLFADLGKDMPDDDEINDMRQRASAEEMGQKTIGHPSKANPGKTEAERREFDVVHQMREDTRRKEEESQWVHDASSQLRDDEEGFKKTLLQKALNPDKYGNFTPAEVKGAQMLVPRLMREAFESGDTDKRKEAFKLAWAYDAGGTEQARALAARRDPFKTPAERSQEFLTKLISTPDPKTRAEINHEIDPNKRQKLLSDAQDAHYAKVVKALGDIGLTPDDLYKGDVDIHLKSSKLVVDAVKGLGDATAQRLGRMILDKFTPGQMAKATGMSKDFVIEKRDKFLANLDAQWDKWLDRGFSEDQIANELRDGDLSKLFAPEDPNVVRKGTMTAEQKAAAKKRLTEMVVGNLKDVDAGKYQRRLKRRVDRPAPYDSRGPSDAPVPDYEPMKQDVMKEGMSPSELAEYNRTRRPGAGTDDARYHQQQLAYEKEQPYEHVKYDPNSIEQTYKLARAIQGAAGNNKFDMVYEAWINSILSGPQTHAMLSAGMGLNAAWNFTMQRGMEAAMNAAFVHDPNSAQIGEFKTIAKAVMPAISRALKFAAKVYKSEEHYAFERQALNTQMEFKGYDKIAGINASIPGVAGRVIRMPSRVVMAQDSFFKQIIGHLEASAQGYRIGKAMGHTGKDLENFIRSQVNLPGSMAWQRAVKMAEEGTFQTELRAWGKGGGPAEGFAKVLQDARHKDVPDSLGGQLGQKALGFVLPFVRTPYNIFRTGLSKTPLGAGAVGMRIANGLYKIKDGKPFFDSYSKAQFVKDLSTQTIAWATAALMYGAVEGDKDDDSKPFLITGSRPHGIAGQGEVDLTNRTVGGPYQIRLGGRNGVSFNYGRIEPFATVISTMADAIRIAKQGQGAGESIATFGKYFASQAQEKTFLQGISSIAEAAENAHSADPGAAMKTVERQVMTGLVPNLIRQPLHNLDDYERDNRNASPLFQATSLGGVANKRIDLYGNATEKAGNPLSRIAARSGDIPTPTLKMGDRFLQNWNRTNPDKPFFPAAPTGADLQYKDASGQKVKMTPDQITEFTRQVGHNFAQSIPEWLTPQMASNPTEDDKKIFEEQHNKAIRQTREDMFGSGTAPRVPSRGTDIKSLMGWR